MIMVIGNIDGKGYKEPFSKGVLARSLTLADMGSKKAYKVASHIESKLIDDNISEITVDDLITLITNFLRKKYPIVAEKYTKWRKIRKTDSPIIILIGGASGVGTSSIAFELANKLGIKNMISTDMIREVMRKIVSKELSPVIHKSSFNAYESTRTFSFGLDPIVEGFINHVDVVNVGIEGVIERAVKEGISIIIEGVHVVPGFLNKELIENHNILLFTLKVSNKEIHKGRFYSRCRQLWSRRPLQVYLDNFNAINKTQDFIISQAEENNALIIENMDVIKTVEIIIDNIVKKFEGINDDK